MTDFSGEERKWEAELNDEITFWNNEYLTVFGENPLIAIGVPIAKVHAVQSRIIRHYVEEMKKALGK